MKNQTFGTRLFCARLGSPRLAETFTWEGRKHPAGCFIRITNLALEQDDLTPSRVAGHGSSEEALSQLERPYARVRHLCQDQVLVAKCLAKLLAKSLKHFADMILLWVLRVCWPLQQAFQQTFQQVEVDRTCEGVVLDRIERQFSKHNVIPPDMINSITLVMLRDGFVLLY